MDENALERRKGEKNQNWAKTGLSHKSDLKTKRNIAFVESVPRPNRQERRSRKQKNIRHFKSRSQTRSSTKPLVLYASSSRRSSNTSR